MLHAQQLTKNFRSTHVLNNLSFIARRDDFIIIMGPNGTGKSTLFDVIAGKVAADLGSIIIDGEDVTLLSEHRRAALVGRLFQNTYQGSCSHLTIRQNIAMARLKTKKASLRNGIDAFDEQIVDELILPLKLNLEKLLDIPMGLLSGGQRQIISFIMTILHKPKVLLLDEPTAALDPISSTLLLQFAKNYAQTHKIPTLLITHDPMIAKHMGNRLWILEEGIIRKELGEEKALLNPHDFFHQIDYKKLSTNKENI